MTVRKVRVGDVLKLQRRAVPVELDQIYQEIGVRSFGNGIFHKEPVSGLEIGTKRVFRIEPGDLVLSNVFAWEGAVAQAAQVDSEKIGSHRFMTFTPTDDRIETGWARWFFVSEPGLKLLRIASPGSAGRNRTLAVERFEALEIPLPDISEQRRTAARLERLSTLREQVSRIVDQQQELQTAHSVSTANRHDLTDAQRKGLGWQRVPLGELLTPSSAFVPVHPSVAYPNAGIYNFGRGMFKKADIDGSTTSAKTLNQIRSGQFIYSRLFAFEGAYTVVPPSLDGRYMSSEFPTFDPEPSRLDARWLANALRSPDHWAKLAASSKGLGLRRQRVQVDSLLAYHMWIPPISHQQTVVSRLAQMEKLRESRAASATRLRAVLPAALNEAFADLT